MTNEEIFRIIEGMLFVSNEPLSIKGIASTIEKSTNETNEIMNEMIKKYEDDQTRGIKIVRTDDKFRLVTKQNIFGYLTKVNSELEKPRITSAMLETLAIIAYKQPVTKLDIENIRGVKTDYIINKLVEYELVCEVGRAEKIGHPILFGTTDKFLIYFGLENLKELPEVEASKAITQENLDEELVKLKRENLNEEELEIIGKDSIENAIRNQEEKNKNEINEENIMDEKPENEE